MYSEFMAMYAMRLDNTAPFLIQGLPPDIEPGLPPDIEPVNTINFGHPIEPAPNISSKPQG